MGDTPAGIICPPWERDYPFDRFFSEYEWDLLQEEIANGYVSCKKHPDFDLFIYNYTVKTQYDWRWNSITIRCRGLILDGHGTLVAKGFDKFFTHEQLITAGEEHLIPTDEQFKLYDKADGSLGVMYFWDETPYISTRGSFISEMAVTANKWLRDMYNHIVFDSRYTYLFEIIYPENRIVLDYGSDRKLVLLAIIDNETLKERDIYDAEFDYIETQGLERVERFDGYSDWTKIIDRFEGDKSKEGFVVHFLESNYRVKMKLEWYKRAAYYMQYFTKKTVWKNIRDGDTVDDIIKDIPDEFYPRVRKYYDDLMVEYNAKLKRVTDMHTDHVAWCVNEYGEDYTIKQFVMKLHRRTNSSFGALVIMQEKNKNLFPTIWRQIEPYGTDHLSDQNI